MTCKKMRQMIPLLIGEEIQGSARETLQSHLESCPACQREYRSMKDAAETMKKWLDDTPVEWEDSQWEQVIRNAAVQTGGPGRPSWIPRPNRLWGWAAASAVLAVLGIGYMLLVHPGGSTGPVSESSLAKIHKPAAQEVVSMTFVSKKTGIKINWFLNKNFHWEEKK